MDNLSVHKNQAVAVRLEVCGCRLVFLPHYSPDFNSIAGAFSKLKTFLRRRAARTRCALERASAVGLATITTQDACGWFGNCGFPAGIQPP